MTNLLSVDVKRQDDVQSEGYSMKDTSPTRESISGSASDHEASEKSTREKLKKASLASMSRPPTQVVRARSEGPTTPASVKISDAHASHEGESSIIDLNHSRPRRKRSFEDLESEVGRAGARARVMGDDSEHQVRKLSRNNAHERCAAIEDDSHPSKASSDATLSQDDMTQSILTYLSPHPSSRQFEGEDIAMLAHGKEFDLVGNETDVSDVNATQLDADASMPHRKHNVDHMMGEGVASPRKKRSRDQLDSEVDREQKIAATEEARAQRLSSEMDDNRETLLSQPKDMGTLGIIGYDESDITHAPKSVFGSTSKLIAPVVQASSASPSKLPEKDVPSQAAFASSGFAALASSAISPFGSIRASSVFNSGPIHKTDSTTGRAATHNVDSSRKTDDLTGSGFSSFAQASRLNSSFSQAIQNSNASPFAASGPVRAGTFGGSIGFGGGRESSGKLASFATPSGDASLSKDAGSIKTIGSSEHVDDDNADTDGDHEEKEDATKDEGDNGTDERFQHQDVETGEDGEQSIFSSRASLYSFKSKVWKESGKGIFKLNIAAAPLDEGLGRTGRFIMRAHQTFRLLLNAPVFKEMNVGDGNGKEPTGKSFAFAVVEDGRALPHMVKLGDASESRALYYAVKELQRDLQ